MSPQSRKRAVSPERNGNGDYRAAILAEARPITADMPLQEQAERLAALGAARPEGSRIIEISPALAEHILTICNTANRPMKPGKVRDYAIALMRGEWGLTGDTVKFAPDGTLRDGQNRLAAIVRSGKPMLTHVVFNVDPTLFAKMDIGRNRTPGDVFHIAGYQYPAQTAATVRWLNILTSDNPNNRGATFSNDELLRSYREKYEPEAIEESIRVGMEVKRKQGAPVASTAALYYILQQAHGETATRFFRDWADGQGGPRAPTRTLQQALTELALAGNGRIHESVRNALVLRAFEAFRQERRLKKEELSFDPSSDPFPEVPAPAQSERAAA